MLRTNAIQMPLRVDRVVAPDLRAFRFAPCWRAGQLDAVGGEHVSPDQALCIAGHQHLAEQRLDMAAKAAD